MTIDNTAALLREFAELPDIAPVRVATVAALFSISQATVWRWCRRGWLPKPEHRGNVSYWRAGELRALLERRQ